MVQPKFFISFFGCFSSYFCPKLTKEGAKIGGGNNKIGGGGIKKFGGGGSILGIVKLKEGGGGGGGSKKSAFKSWLRLGGGGGGGSMYPSTCSLSFVGASANLFKSFINLKCAVLFFLSRLPLIDSLLNRLEPKEFLTLNS